LVVEFKALGRKIEMLEKRYALERAKAKKKGFTKKEMVGIERRWAEEDAALEKMKEKEGSLMQDYLDKAARQDPFPVDEGGYSGASAAPGEGGVFAMNQLPGASAPSIQDRIHQREVERKRNAMLEDRADKQDVGGQLVAALQTVKTADGRDLNVNVVIQGDMGKFLRVHKKAVNDQAAHSGHYGMRGS